LKNFGVAEIYMHTGFDGGGCWSRAALRNFVDT
jgi:hypothetical protein